MSYSLQLKASRNIVVDANLAAATVIPIAGLEMAETLFVNWAQEDCPLYAPGWWLAEVISVLRQHVFRKLISPASGREIAENVFALEVKMISVDIPLCQRALDWAEAINHSKIYDSVYLALAERLHADFWTADKKLAETARAAGARWAHWAGEA